MIDFFHNPYNITNKVQIADCFYGRDLQRHISRQVTVQSNIIDQLEFLI